MLYATLSSNTDDGNRHKTLRNIVYTRTAMPTNVAYCIPLKGHRCLYCERKKIKSPAFCCY